MHRAARHSPARKTCSSAVIWIRMIDSNKKRPHPIKGTGVGCSVASMSGRLYFTVVSVVSLTSDTCPCWNCNSTPTLPCRSSVSARSASRSSRRQAIRIICFVWSVIASCRFQDLRAELLSDRSAHESRQLALAQYPIQCLLCLMAHHIYGPTPTTQPGAVEQAGAFVACVRSFLHQLESDAVVPTRLPAISARHLAPYSWLPQLLLARFVSIATPL